MKMLDAVSRRGLVLTLAILGGCATPAAAQAYKLAELNTEQIRALDRARTVILIPGGSSRARIEVAMKILDGADERQFPRYGTTIMSTPGITAVMEKSEVRSQNSEVRSENSEERASAVRLLASDVFIEANRF
jgi:hypothetical protein